METHEVMMQGAKLIQAAMSGPDDDWSPVMAVTNSTGETAIVDVSMFFVDDSTRQMFAESVLPKMVVDMDVQELVLVTSAWILTLDEDEYQAGFVRPRDNPERSEILQVAVVTGDGVEAWHAAIGRDPRGGSPPTLGEFVKQPGVLTGLIDKTAETMAKRGSDGGSVSDL